MSENDRLQIRSYSVCFRLERRLHKIDRWRIPLPYGLPLKGLGYGLATLIAVIVLSRLPVFGAVLGMFHPTIRYLIIPGFTGWLMIRLQVDGRSAPSSGLAWLRWRSMPRRIVAFQRTAPPVGPFVLGAITIAPDERSARCRRGVIEGNGSVILRYPCNLTARGRTLHVKQQSTKPSWRGKQVRLAPGQRMVVE
jgi:hypothetical protein